MTDAARSEPFDVAALLHNARLNWRLWTIFQAEVSSVECKLPVEIRQNMIALCNFVDKATVELISDPQPDKITVLVNINREIASGLLASADAGAKQAQTESADSSSSAPAEDLPPVISNSIDQTS